MKNLKNIFYILLPLLMVFSACDNTELYPKYGEAKGESYVAFSSGSYSVDESTLSSFADGSSLSGPSTGTIMLTRSANDISSELTVAVNLTAVYTDDNDFVSAGEDASSAIKVNGDLSNIVFPANSSSAEFSIATIDDNLAKGNIQVNLSIASVSDSKYQIGYQSGQTRQEATFTVVDDDCPVDLDMLTGTFELVVSDLGDGTSETREVTIERDPSNPFGIIVNDLVVFGTVPTTTVPLTIVTCPQALVYDPEFPIGLYQGANNVLMQRRDGFFTGQAGPHFAEAGLDLDPDDPLDWGFYDDEAGKLTIYAWLFVDPLGSFGGFQFDLTKIE